MLNRLKAFTVAIDRLPAPVSTYPGFLVNRALTPYLLEAIVLLDEGVSKETIDRAAEHFGMPMGPVEVADQVGLDVCLHVADSLIDDLDKPMPAIPDWFRKQVDEGKLGRKTGEGLYRWDGGKAQKQDASGKAPDDLTDRLLLPLLNACGECLRKGLVDDEEVVDAAMIFATGFAPFRGGPMHYARTRGFKEIADRLDALTKSHGDRFEADPFWRQ